jgi:hypothetical protein
MSEDELIHIFHKHIELDWLNASDGHPDIVGFAEAAKAILANHVIVPRELTFGNGAKEALIGEFYEEFEFMTEDGEEDIVKVTVSWTTIKAIHKKMVAHFSTTVTSHNGTKI